MWLLLSCYALLDVSTTNWLPTGIQGAKGPLDGQRLDVYPGLNVSKSLVCVMHQNQPSSLGPTIKEQLEISSLPTSAPFRVHPACQDKFNFIYFFSGFKLFRDSLGLMASDMSGFYLILLLKAICHSRHLLNMLISVFVAFHTKIVF